MNNSNEITPFQLFPGQKLITPFLRLIIVPAKLKIYQNLKKFIEEVQVNLIHSSEATGVQL